MELVRLQVRRFRNIENAELTFPSRITVLNGDNAQGKTNLIEAACVLSTLRSFRTRKVSELVMEGMQASEIGGEVRAGGFNSSLHVSIDRHGKTAKMDGRTPTSAQEYLSALQPVLFTPWDLELSLGNQEMRRSYLDRAAFLRDGSHLSLLRRYGRMLRQRNALLRDPASGLHVWSEQMAEAGSAIRRARTRVLAELGPFLEGVHKEVSGGSETLLFHWDGNGSRREDSPQELLRELEAAEGTDRRNGHTSVGPHRDSLRVSLCGRDSRVHASRGQHRTAALSLKIAFLLWASEALGEEPVFLLDDPGSELDTQRLAYIGSFLSRWKGQVVIACTPEANLSFDQNTKPFLYHVSAGGFEAVN